MSGCEGSTYPASCDVTNTDGRGFLATNVSSDVGPACDVVDPHSSCKEDPSKSECTGEKLVDNSSVVPDESKKNESDKSSPVPGTCYAGVKAVCTSVMEPGSTEKS